MKQLYSLLTPAERAAFFAEKQGRFLESLARELDLLDPARKGAEQCFQPRQKARRPKG
jgi:hypothetical protein